jgi:signal peptidase II
MRGIFLSLLVVGLALIDQISKWWVIERYYKPRVFESIEASQPFFPWLTRLGQDQFPATHLEMTSFFNMVMVWNKGVSFGMFASGHDYMPFILSGAALALCAVLIVWMVRAKHWTTLIPLAMIVAGAIANVWDRIRFGGVADFFDFHYRGMHYPAFNIADCCIVMGVIALAIDGVLIEPRRIKKEA